MKNMKKKFIAGVLLSAFALSNTSLATLAMDDYYGNYRPQIRSVGNTSKVGVDTKLNIQNGDSVVNLSLRDAELTQVLRMFADQAGMNIIFADGVAEGEKGPKTVTLDLVDIPLKEALDIVIKTKGLFYDIQANTIVVSTKENALTLAPRTKDVTIIPVKYVNATAISHFLNKSIFGAKSKGAINTDLSYGMIVATNPATNELIINGTENDIAFVRKFVEQFDRKPQVTTIKVNHTTPAEMASAICGSLFPSMGVVGDEGGESGGAAGIPTGFASDSSSSSGGGGGSSLGIAVSGGTLACGLSVIQKTEESESEDGETEKVASLSSLNLLNMSVSYFPTLGTIQIVGGSDSQIQMIKDYVAENDKKTPQAYIEMQVVSLSEAGSKEFNNNWQFYSKHFSFNANSNETGFGNIPQYPIFFAGQGLTTYDTSSYPYEVNGYFSKYSGSPTLVYSVKYLVESSKGRVVANPKVLVTNGQKSIIDLSSDYVKKVTTEYLDSSSLNSQVQRTYEIGDDKGIKIEITPFISPDGYVTLDIKPDYTTISGQIYAPGSTGEDELQATLLQRRNLEIKGARVKDGETLVIGGLITEDEEKTVSKVPFLGDIPVLGMFFRSTKTTRNKEEMVMLITPKIIIDTEDAVSDDTSL